jgi:NAD(P)H-hydrate epimerase
MMQRSLCLAARVLLFSACSSPATAASYSSTTQWAVCATPLAFARAAAWPVIRSPRSAASMSGQALPRPPPPPFELLHLVGQDDSVAIDQELFKSFSVDSLMELAGLSVAEAVLKTFPPHSFADDGGGSDGTDGAGRGDRFGRVLIAAGPGNNGGDGLVAARHLVHFGYGEVVVFYPKPTDAPLFHNLQRQCAALGVELITDPNFDPPDLDTRFDLIVDAVFGFSFRGKPREPFVTILKRMAETRLPVVAVDVPSGCVWLSVFFAPHSRLCFHVTRATGVLDLRFTLEGGTLRTVLRSLPSGIRRCSSR